MHETGNREFHQAANLFPLLEGAALEHLVADIRQNGLLEPIPVDAEGQILDGRNRYRACLAAGIEPRFTTWEGGLKNQSQPSDPPPSTEPCFTTGEAEGLVVELVMSRNLHRRHLNESQRALVAARLAKMLEADAVKRRGRRLEKVANLPPIPLGKSRDKAAATLHVSPRLVTHALRVVNQGSAELVHAVEAGRISVSKASHGWLPAAEQGQAAASGCPPRAVRRQPARSNQPWPFGVLVALKPADPAFAFLWVASAGLAEAVDALQDRGFQYTPPVAGPG